MSSFSVATILICLYSMHWTVRIHRSCPSEEDSVWSRNESEPRFWAVGFVEYHPLIHVASWSSDHLLQQLPAHLEKDKCELKRFKSFDYRAFQTSHAFIIRCQETAPTHRCTEYLPDLLLPVPLLESTIGDLIVNFIAKDDSYHATIMYDTARFIPSDKKKMAQPDWDWEHFNE